MPLAIQAVAPSRASYTVAFGAGSPATLRGLTPSERCEHERLPHDARRSDWLAGRLAAKRAVAARCGLAIENIQLQPKPGAAPECQVRRAFGQWTPLPLSVSIAHRDGVAIAAAADGDTLAGVDIERAGEITPAQHRYFLAPREKSLTPGIDAMLVWMLKEAVWKALGLGSALPFTAVQLAFDSTTGTLRGVWIESAWMTAHARVLRLQTRPELVAVVVAIRGGAQ
jgi:phosphopantetheinyl transferase